MLTLYFVRHGETDWNVENKVQGQLDSNLTDKGMEDVLSLQSSIKDISWNTIYSSPSRRALHTAELLTRQSKHIICDNRIKEMSLGALEGMTWDDIRKYNQKEYNNYWNDPKKFKIPSGENFFDVKKRVTHFLHDVSQQCKEGNVLVVTHGVIIKIVQVIAQNNDIGELWATPHVSSASVTTVKVDATNNDTKIIEFKL